MLREVDGVSVDCPDEEEEEEEDAEPEVSAPSVTLPELYVYDVNLNSYTVPPVVKSCCVSVAESLAIIWAGVSEEVSILSTNSPLEETVIDVDLM